MIFPFFPSLVHHTLDAQGYHKTVWNIGQPIGFQKLFIQSTPLKTTSPWPGGLAFLQQSLSFGWNHRACSKGRISRGEGCSRGPGVRSSHSVPVPSCLLPAPHQCLLPRGHAAFSSSTFLFLLSAMVEETFLLAESPQSPLSESYWIGSYSRDSTRRQVK